MDGASILGFVQESIFVISVFVGFLVYAIVRGRHSLINLIVGLYFALLISLEFPYYDTILSGAASPQSEAALRIAVFIVFTIISTVLLGRLLHSDGFDRGFSGFHRKFIYALAATILVLTYSFHALPVTELIDPGPIQALFNSESSFFFWLFVPIIVLFFL